MSVTEISMRMQQLRRYIAPLREGGSLPALGEADDGFRYVVKLRGAGHGTRSLIAETIGAAVARMAGLRVPEMVFLDLDADFGRTEPDEEVQELLRKSEGLNVGMHFLDGAFTWDVAVNRTDALTASMIVWVDDLLTNVDRTARNTNMLIWHDELWLIDFGSCLLFQHNWPTWQKAALSPFTYIKDHALLPSASLLADVDAMMHQRLTTDMLEAAVDLVPDQWFADIDPGNPELADLVPMMRAAWRGFLTHRFENSKIFTDHAIAARNALV